MAKKTKKRLLTRKVTVKAGDVVALISSTTHDTPSPWMTVEDADDTLIHVVWFTENTHILQRATLQLNTITKLIKL